MVVSSYDTHNDLRLAVEALSGEFQGADCGPAPINYYTRRGSKVSGSRTQKVGLEARLRQPSSQHGVSLSAHRVAPRITRLMALAIKFQEMVDRREVRDYADLARLGYVSRARITQIMNLLNLAPDIQESLLLGPKLPSECPIRETRLRGLTGIVDWTEQRRLWPSLQL